MTSFLLGSSRVPKHCLSLLREELTIDQRLAESRRSSVSNCVDLTSEQQRVLPNKKNAVSSTSHHVSRQTTRDLPDHNPLKKAHDRHLLPSDIGGRLPRPFWNDFLTDVAGGSGIGPVSTEFFE